MTHWILLIVAAHERIRTQRDPSSHKAGGESVSSDIRHSGVFRFECQSVARQLIGNRSISHSLWLQ